VTQTAQLNRVTDGLGTRLRQNAGGETIRVFPRRTRATPTDAYAFVGEPGLFVPEDATQVHVSVAFTYDLPHAEYLAKSWERTGLTVQIGGPATGQRSEEFVPGRYLKPGYVITSRGCPNRCCFCSVWKREGDVRELPITEGWNVLDDNLLACSESHVRAVFDMLKRQTRRAEFTGGLEAARLADWHVDGLVEIRTNRLYCAYDTADDLEPLRQAGKKLIAAGFTREHHLSAYCLVGYPRDTFDAAEKRLREAWEAGFMPMAMLWHTGHTDMQWRQFQRQYARPAIARELLEVCK
jgi:hypothetical protein